LFSQVPSGGGGGGSTTVAGGAGGGGAAAEPEAKEEKKEEEKVCLALTLASAACSLSANRRSRTTTWALGCSIERLCICVDYDEMEFDTFAPDLPRPGLDRPMTRRGMGS
jgi:hypothetical protein